MTAEDAVAGFSGIRRIIPHRYPVLLVDRVSEVDRGSGIVTVKAVSGREPCYEGDVPDAYPLGLLMESWAQSAVLLTRWDNPNTDVRADKVELISGIRDVVVYGDVVPGDVVEHHIRLVREVADAAILAGHSLVAGRKVLEVGSFTMARRRAEELG